MQRISASTKPSVNLNLGQLQTRNYAQKRHEEDNIREIVSQL